MKRALVRVVHLDPATRDRAAVLAALAHARELAAAAMSATLGLTPPLGSDADFRWYTREVLEAFGEPRDAGDAPLPVAVELWPPQLALLTAGDLPVGVLAVVQPEGDRAFRRVGPIPGTFVARGPRPVVGLPPLELVADLAASRFVWAGALASDATFRVLADTAAARARRHGDVTVLEDTTEREGDRGRLVVAVRLPPIGALTPVADLAAAGASVLASVWAPAQELTADVNAAVAAARARLAALALTSARE